MQMWRLTFIKAAAQAENLALNKPVVTSSTLPGKYGSMAVDGLANTQWSSAAGDHWIWVDLLAEYQLENVTQLLLQHFGFLKIVGEVYTMFEATWA